MQRRSRALTRRFCLREGVASSVGGVDGLACCVVDECADERLRDAVGDDACRAIGVRRPDGCHRRVMCTTTSVLMVPVPVGE